MPRFFMPDAGEYGDEIIIRGKNAEHIKVLRLRVGEELTVCDGNGTDYKCALLRSDKDEAAAKLLSVEKCPAEPSVYVKILCGLPKGDKTDYIIQKSVEAGASEIIFFDSDRVIARPETAEKKLERWQRISEEAAKQCGRGIIPELKWCESFEDALNEANKTELGLFMYEAGERETLPSALSGSEKIKTAAIVTGPEGGFEKDEADKARKAGLHVCSMGERILRCETAPIVALTALMYESGNLN